MSLISFPSRCSRQEYIEALKIIWTRPVNPGRFYLGSALQLHKSESVDAYFKRLLKRDDQKGTTRPVSVYLTDFEMCFESQHKDGHIKAFAYELHHKKVWPPLLNVSFLFCDELVRNSGDYQAFEDLNRHMEDLGFLQGNFSKRSHQTFYFNE